MLIRGIALFLLVGSLSPAAPQTAPTPPTGRISVEDALNRSPLARQLAQCGEDAAGIRNRLELIREDILRNPAAYHVEALSVPDIALIPISVEEGDGRHLGGAQWAANNSIIKFRMSIFTAPLPEATDEDSRLLREMVLNDTLVHELVHCCFYFRYPKLAKIQEGEPLVICEGHAIHAARSFIQRHYFGGTAMPLPFYEKVFLSPRYKRLYAAFLPRYTNAEGRIQWSLLDSAELSIAPPGYTLRNRVQL
ncbi:MAG: hypothetical protein IJA63_11050 [Akkermansia sp.]|nr:hypothetical protein [Akkermansia sp.]